MTTKEYAGWLIADMETWDRYHDHKETMAWAATAFHLPAIVGLAFVLYRSGLDSLAKTLFTMSVLIAGVIVTFFVSMQFTNRWEEFDKVKGLHRALARLYDPTQPLSHGDRLIECFEEWKYPRFVRIELAQARTKRGRKVFLKTLLYFISFQWKRPDDRPKTELSSYLAIFGASVVAVILVWTCG